MPNSDFVSTQWSLVLRARDRSTAEGAAALADLCRLYWHPLYAYVRRRGLAVEDAQDLTQSFFAQLLEKDYLRRAKQDRGKLRSFLLASIKNFMANEWDRAHAQKRGGDLQFLSVETIARAEGDYRADDVFAGMTPDRYYERSWALTLLDRATAALAAEFAAAGKTPIFDSLKTFLTGDADSPGYPQLARTLGMSEGAVRVAVHRLRTRFRDLLCAEIANTLPNPGDPHAIQEELRDLLALL
jgi:RNA polymerase sigma-70 factor (ECF subfamily)